MDRQNKKNLTDILAAKHELQNTKELENVSIANALQLEAARRRTVPIRFNFVTRAKFEDAQPI